MKTITIGNIIQFILGAAFVFGFLYLMWPILLMIGVPIAVVFGLNHIFRFTLGKHWW